MALPPLITADDVAARINRDLTDVERGVLEAAVLDSSASIRSFTSQQFTAKTGDSVIARVAEDFVNGQHRLYIRLPQRPVTAVSAVTDPAGNAVTFSWELDDKVWFWWIPPTPGVIRPYLYPPRNVTAVYDHGYAADAIPDDVIAVAVRMCGRALGHDPDEAVTTQEKIDEYSHRDEPPIASLGLGLEPDEKAMLAHYRRPFGALKLA